MQTVTKGEHSATEALVENLGQPMAYALQAEGQSLRQDIREPKILLAQAGPIAAPKESPAS